MYIYQYKTIFYITFTKVLDGFLSCEEICSPNSSI